MTLEEIQEKYTMRFGSPLDHLSVDAIVAAQVIRQMIINAQSLIVCDLCLFSLILS